MRPDSQHQAYGRCSPASRGIKGAGELSKRHSRLVDYFFENTRDPIDVRRNDAAPDDVEAKKSSSARALTLPAGEKLF
jgi:hypothetical protein